jgi:hypothetical protein
VEARRRFRRPRDPCERDAVVGAHQLDRLLPVDGLEVLQILDIRVRGEVTHADDHLGDRRAVLLRPLAHAASDLVGGIERGLRGGTILLDPLDRPEHLPLRGRPEPRDCSRSSTHTRAPPATAPWHSASAGSRCSPSSSRPRRQPASSIPSPTRRRSPLCSNLVLGNMQFVVASDPAALDRVRRAADARRSALAV